MLKEEIQMTQGTVRRQSKGSGSRDSRTNRESLVRRCSILLSSPVSLLTSLRAAYRRTHKQEEVILVAEKVTRLRGAFHQFVSCVVLASLGSTALNIAGNRPSHANPKTGFGTSPATR